MADTPAGFNSAVTLREYLERAHNDAWRAHSEKHRLENVAIEQARNAIDLRLEKLNELRSEVIQDRGEYVRRDVHDSQIKGLQDKLDALESFRTKAVGAAAVLTLVSGAVGAAIVKALGG